MLTACILDVIFLGHNLDFSCFCKTTWSSRRKIIILNRFLDAWRLLIMHFNCNLNYTEH